ncbi:protein of unknown function [Pararobbsia alpina]
MIYQSAFALPNERPPARDDGRYAHFFLPKRFSTTSFRWLAGRLLAQPSERAARRPEHE